MDEWRCEGDSLTPPPPVSSAPTGGKKAVEASQRWKKQKLLCQQLWRGLGGGTVKEEEEEGEGDKGEGEEEEKRRRMDKRSMEAG